MLPPGFILAAMFRFGYKMTRRGNNDIPGHRTIITEMGIPQSRENQVYYNAKLLGVLLVIAMMAIIAIYFEYIEPYVSNS
jgi:predicted outer membrane lipoprotein